MSDDAARRAALVRQRRREERHRRRSEIPPAARRPAARSPGGFGGIAASSRSNGCCAKAGRNSPRRPWTPHRPPRPEKSEGGKRFVIASDFEPKGDQPQAINELVEGVRRSDRTQVLLGVTGSGKTFTMAKVIEATQRPALILAPNKTLAAQLYGEFKSFFPDNAVEYFVSLLRLLPAGSLRAAHRHLYREGILDQRADRPHAPLPRRARCSSATT